VHETHDDYTRAVAVGSVFLASWVTTREQNTDRQKKMSRVVREKIKLVSVAWPDKEKPLRVMCAAGL